MLLKEIDEINIYPNDGDIAVYVGVCCNEDIEYIKIYKDTLGYQLMCRISLFKPVYIRAEDENYQLNRNDIEKLMRILNNDSWDSVIESLKKTYLSDIYTDLGKSEIALPMNPPDYRLL